VADLERGEALFAEGRLAEAEAIFRSALTAEPARALNDLAVVAHRRGAPWEAVGYLMLAVHHAPSGLDAWINLLETLDGLDMLSLARPLLDSMPRDGELGALRASALDALGGPGPDPLPGALAEVGAAIEGMAIDAARRSAVHAQLHMDHAPGLDRLMAWADALGFDADRPVVDACAGTGARASALRGSGYTVVGIDETPALLHVARQMTRRLSGDPLPAVAARAERLPLADGAVGGLVFERPLWPADREALLLEFQRVLGAGGRLYLGGAGPGRALEDVIRAGIMGGDGDALRHGLDAALSAARVDAGLVMPAGHPTVLGIDRLLASLAALGFVEVERPSVHLHKADFLGLTAWADAKAAMPDSPVVGGGEASAEVDRLLELGLYRTALARLPERADAPGLRLRRLFALTHLGAPGTGDAVDAIEPPDGRSHLLKARVAEATGGLLVAVAHARGALAQADDDRARADAHFVLGECQRALGLDIRAERHYAQVVELDGSVRGWCGRLALNVDAPDRCRAIAQAFLASMRDGSGAGAG